MTPEQLRSGRERRGLTQQRAAALLGLSQPYLSQLEQGRRPVTPKLARLAARRLRLGPTALRVPEMPEPGRRSEEALVRELAALGYPGYAHVRASAQVNPAELVLEGLSRDDLDGRLAAALPWVLLRYDGMSWDWLLGQVKARNLQNRLGFLVALAREAARSHGRSDLADGPLKPAGEELERARLVARTTLCRESMPDAERSWLRRHRPALARHWNVLTSLAPEHVLHVPEPVTAS